MVASLTETPISFSRSVTVNLAVAGPGFSPLLRAIAQQHSCNAQRTLRLHTVKIRYLQIRSKNEISSG